MTLPLSLFSAAQIRALEASAIASGVPGYSLMKRAASAASAVLFERWPDARSIAIVCGGGNNGGDGLALAKVLVAAGREVAVLNVVDPALLRGEAARALADLDGQGVKLGAFSAAAVDCLRGADVVVDALLGIGVRAPLDGQMQRAIAAINDCGRPVLALDLPSGLDADRGMALPAVKATATLSFIGLKQGLFLGDGPECAGTVYCDALGLESAVTVSAASMRRLDVADLRSFLPPRPRHSHKGAFGSVLIIGGGQGMPGAVRLAGEAALRVGAGRVTIASLAGHEAIVLAGRPELMFRAVADADALARLLPDFDVVAIGPGLGQDAWGASLLHAVLGSRIGNPSLVVDADALNLLAGESGITRRDDWILTPHPGEAGRLLGLTASQVQADRPAALAALVKQRGGTVVLKGAGTLIGSGNDSPLLSDRGNPGMAVPGMGDVLTGALAGLWAQRRDADAAEVAAAGVWLHATAGDRCTQDGLRGMLALEVAGELRRVLAGVCP